ncbi:MAG: adenylate/guanylate cyclase domain-containing protein [Rhodospirillales bacterium]|nr:MAG: adenylate/guanylate cyclase domain-containing protein [Rhodospirillales bacterium]
MPDRAQPRRIATLELRVRRTGGDWQRVGVYAPAERPDALEAARSLERQAGIAAVKLVKETFDPDGEDTTTVTVYRSASLDMEAGPLEGPSAEGAGGPEASGAPAGRRSAEAIVRSLVGGGARFLAELRALMARLATLSPARLRPGEAHAPASPAAGPPKATPAASDRWTDRAEADRLPPLLDPPPSRWRDQVLQVWCFLEDARDRIDHFRRTRDNFGLFGVCFFVAGACAVLQDDSDMSADDGIGFLADCLAVVGLTPARARIFAERCGQYLMQNRRYLAMFQAGVAAISAYRAHNISGSGSLETALQRWTEPQAAGGAAGRRLTLMFTDIVGSTMLAAEQGDEAAVQVIRIHNQIVETVLHQIGGLHVKNLGDGTLAVFDDTATGIKAALVIQRCIEEHNRSRPGPTLQVRIGLNVGPAIVEAGDLIGATVNLASRVCQAAAPAEILCTAAVRDAVGDRDAAAAAFREYGAHAIKGYREPVVLYRVEPRTKAPQPATGSGSRQASPPRAASAGVPATAA